ncbi:hypothetical protein AURDEDRAFT_182646 [Auricularia subglabra TFB-10046 SS5]|nr:hypothetical protein AURDEDRAFT_182646 [Auricularia subglabra TFB-10046 SS5]
MILTPPTRAYSPSPSPPPVASTSQPARVLDCVLLPRLPHGWLSDRPAPVPVRNDGDGGPQAVDKMCHQCRNTKNPRPRYRCGRAGCVLAFCTGCLARSRKAQLTTLGSRYRRCRYNSLSRAAATCGQWRTAQAGLDAAVGHWYKWTEHELHGAGCAVCRGVCNCSICLDKQGLGAHKAFLTAFTREGGCARAWLAQRGLLCERAAPPSRKKNFAKRPKILGKKQTAGAAQKIKHKKHASKMEEEEGRSRGRWMIDASAAACKKFERRWAMERGVRAEQVRLGKRRWFVGELSNRLVLCPRVLLGSVMGS